MEQRGDRRGLGRGLSALMADTQGDSGTTGPKSGARQLPVAWISPNPLQPRQDFDQASLESLAESIRQKGILQPLIVRPAAAPDRYELVAGERRWRAAQMAQLHDVPVIVRELDDTDVLEIAIIENIQRADLNAIEEALGYSQLIERFGHTQERLATALSKSRSHIANLLRLLTLPEPVQAFVRSGELSAGHARALITSGDPAALARVVIAKGLSVRETERLAKSARPPTPQPRQEGGEKDADTRALEGDLSANLGMAVRIQHERGGVSGLLTVHYRSLDDLDRLCHALSNAPKLGEF